MDKKVESISLFDDKCIPSTYDQKAWTFIFNVNTVCNVGGGWGIALKRMKDIIINT